MITTMINMPTIWDGLFRPSAETSPRLRRATTLSNPASESRLATRSAMTRAMTYATPRITAAAKSLGIASKTWASMSESGAAR